MFSKKQGHKKLQNLQLIWRLLSKILQFFVAFLENMNFNHDKYR